MEFSPDRAYVSNTLYAESMPGLAGVTYVLTGNNNPEAMNSFNDTEAYILVPRVLLGLKTVSKDDAFSVKHSNA